MKKGFILVLLFALCSCDANNISKKPAIEGDFTRIIACSDFQNENGHSVSIDNMIKITDALKNDGITKSDAFFSCGDYDYNTTDNIAGINNTAGICLAVFASLVYDKTCRYKRGADWKPKEC